MKFVYHWKKRKMFFTAKKIPFILFKVLIFFSLFTLPWYSSKILCGTQACKYRIMFQKISVKISSTCLTLKSSGIKTYASDPVQCLCFEYFKSIFSPKLY